MLQLRNPLTYYNNICATSAQFNAEEERPSNGICFETRRNTKDGNEDLNKVTFSFQDMHGKILARIHI